MPVQLLAPAAGDDSGHALRAQVEAALDPTAASWAALSGAASQLVAQRHRLQAAVIDQREQEIAVRAAHR